MCAYRHIYIHHALLVTLTLSCATPYRLNYIDLRDPKQVKTLYKTRDLALYLRLHLEYNRIESAFDQHTMGKFQISNLIMTPS